MKSLFHQQQQFTSDVAHELQIPASIISAECQHLKSYGGTISDYMDSLTVIARQIAKTNEIITQLLQAFPLRTGENKEDFEILLFKDLIESICEGRTTSVMQKQISVFNTISKTYLFT
ncbi:MAG: hypothetical protein ACLTS6_03630 [Anaerobutyricum sp.]